MDEFVSLDPMNSDDVEIIKKVEAYRGYSRVIEYRLKHRLFAGGWSEEISREVLDRGTAVCVLPYDPVRDEVILVEQFRIGAMQAGLPPWQMEIVAGVKDPGETQEQVAHRELREEAGIDASRLHFVCEALSSSGIVSEVVSVWCGIVDASGAGGVHGLDHEHEDIRVSVHSFNEAQALMREGTIKHLQTIAALQWLELNREWLCRNAKN